MRAMERALGDEDLAVDVRDPRKHSFAHHPPDRVFGDLQHLSTLCDRVDGRLAGAQAVQVGTEAAADRSLDGRHGIGAVFLSAPTDEPAISCRQRSTRPPPDTAGTPAS
jgi:hypothetical protein